MFGEVYDADPAFMSPYTTEGKLPATLDFGFQAAAHGLRARAGRRPSLRDCLRRRRLLHRHRLQRLRAADLPRQPRHGPRSACFLKRTAGATGDDLLAAGRAGQRADVPHPRPAGRLLRRRAGLHRRRRRQGRPAGHVRQPGRATTTTTTVIGTDTPRAASDRYDTSHPLYQQIAALSALRKANPALADGAQIHRYAARRRRHLRVQPDRRPRPGRVPRRRQQRHHREDGHLRHLHRRRSASTRSTAGPATGRSPRTRRPGDRHRRRRCRSRCGRRPTG